MPQRESARIDVLKIRPGYIDLPGFDYGFIGGASFKPQTQSLLSLEGWTSIRTQSG